MLSITLSALHASPHPVLKQTAEACALRDARCFLTAPASRRAQEERSLASAAHDLGSKVAAGTRDRGGNSQPVTDSMRNRRPHARLAPQWDRLAPILAHRRSGNGLPPLARQARPAQWRQTPARSQRSTARRSLCNASPAIGSCPTQISEYCDTKAQPFSSYWPYRETRR
jgi:hypothetical protein